MRRAALVLFVLLVAALAGAQTGGSRTTIAPWPGPLLPPSVISTAMTGTTSTQVVAAVVGSYLYLTGCQFSNDHASQDTMMLLQDGNAGATIWKGNVPHGGGNNPPFTGWLPVPTRGNPVFAVNVTTGSSTYVACQGFSSPTKLF